MQLLEAIDHETPSLRKPQIYEFRGPVYKVVETKDLSGQPVKKLKMIQREIFYVAANQLSDAAKLLRDLYPDFYPNVVRWRGTFEKNS